MYQLQRICTILFIYLRCISPLTGYFQIIWSGLWLIFFLMNNFISCFTRKKKCFSCEPILRPGRYFFPNRQVLVTLWEHIWVVWNNWSTTSYIVDTYRHTASNMSKRVDSVIFTSTALQLIRSIRCTPTRLFQIQGQCVSRIIKNAPWQHWQRYVVVKLLICSTQV
jgi:hypothetical protein